ncbi:hypothetical protein ACN47E_001429 [Coniothyrium glycines]
MSPFNIKDKILRSKKTTATRSKPTGSYPSITLAPVREVVAIQDHNSNLTEPTTPRHSFQPQGLATHQLAGAQFTPEGNVFDVSRLSLNYEVTHQPQMHSDISLEHERLTPLQVSSLYEVDASPRSIRQTENYRPSLYGRASPSTYRITAENIREIREMIRYRYALDIKIWKKKDNKGHARDYLQELMHKSNATLVHIRKILESWDRREYFETDEEHAKFKEIKDRIEYGQKMIWKDNRGQTESVRDLTSMGACYEMNGGPPSVRHDSVHSRQTPAQPQRVQSSRSPPQHIVTNPIFSTRDRVSVAASRPQHIESTAQLGQGSIAPGSQIHSSVAVSGYVPYQQPQYSESPIPHHNGQLVQSPRSHEAATSVKPSPALTNTAQQDMDVSFGRQPQQISSQPQWQATMPTPLRIGPQGVPTLHDSPNSPPFQQNPTTIPMAGNEQSFHHDRQRSASGPPLAEHHIAPQHHHRVSSTPAQMHPQMHAELHERAVQLRGPASIAGSTRSAPLPSMHTHLNPYPVRASASMNPFVDNMVGIEESAYESTRRRHGE